MQTLVQRLGGTPDTGGSLSGAVRRGWAEIKEAVSGRDDLAVLEEVERGEDKAVAAYLDALDEALPEDVRNVIERQYLGVLENHHRVRELRERYYRSAT